MSNLQSCSYQSAAAHLVLSLLIGLMLAAAGCDSTEVETTRDTGQMGEVGVSDASGLDVDQPDSHFDIGGQDADAAERVDISTDPDVEAADTDQPDVVEIDAGPDASEPCPALSHSLPRDMRQSYNLGNNPNYPGSSTEMLWFHEPGGENPQTMSLLVDHYAALEFSTGDAPATGSTSFEAITSLVETPGSTVLAFSTCPGQFVDLPDTCVITGYLPGLNWSVGHPDDDYPFACALEANATYYLNVAHAASATDLDDSSCSDPDECGSIFTHRGTYTD
jgi:hypothetical protein